MAAEVPIEVMVWPHFDDVIFVSRYDGDDVIGCFMGEGFIVYDGLWPAHDVNCMCNLLLHCNSCVVLYIQVAMLLLADG